MNYNLAQPFYDSARKYPDRSAISANGEELLYGDVLRQVIAVSGWLRSRVTIPNRVGILASRSPEACIAILATAWIGATYLPLNLALPEVGLLGIMKRSGLDALIADKSGSQLLSAQLLAACPSTVLAWRNRIPGETSGAITDYIDLRDSTEATEPVHVDSNAPGYILYTSGSTGTPKGVVVPVGAVEQLLRFLDSKYPLRETDRVAETAATSFDISVYNMFATWLAGASLHIVPPEQLMAPAKFIQEHEITMWFSVPSIATIMARMKLLKPGTFPSLRQTFFCGEPLSGSVAADWQKAAPSAAVVNMYGPTEATVMCTGEDFGPACAMTQDIVAIGRPFAGMKVAVAAPDLTWVGDGTSGELLLSGPQLAIGYLDDPEKTKSKFVDIDGARWYKTGDLARRDRNGVFHFLGRVDNQVKVLGYRIELEEIEYHLREASGCELVAVIAWPRREGIATGLVAVVCNFKGNVSSIKDALAQRLPFYMVPTQIHVRSELPLNNNGKLDRNALIKLVTEKLAD